MTLGFVLRLNLVEYQLLGIPLLLIFQLRVQRRPLLTLWVRKGPRLQLDSWFFILWVLSSLAPAYDLLQAVARGDSAYAMFYCAALVGAFGLAYALRAMRAVTVRQTGLCILTVCGIVILPMLLSLLLPSALHLHIRGPANAVGDVSLLHRLKAGAGRFLLLPVGFMVEEVFFRGALDTYLHQGEEGTGWLSAIFVSVLWGVWHLRRGTLGGRHFLPATVGVIAAQILVGVPLSLWWRRSGNLVVTDTTHAFLEAVRSLLGVA
jgi:hypothetical protein